VVGGSSGTFASFNAEVTNSGNYFATGTLLLHDFGGTNTCTSESTATNANNGGGDTCDILYHVPLTAVSSTLGSGLTSGVAVTSLTVGAISGGAIDAGDSIVVTSGSNTQTFTTTRGTDVGGTTITVSSQNANFSYPVGSTVTDSQGIHYAQLTLTNAGTLEASDIKFESPSPGCQNSSPGQVNATLSSGLTGGVAITSLPVSALTVAVRSGDVITVSDGTNTDSFTASAAAGIGATSIPVTSHAPVNSYISGNNVIYGPNFGAGDLCTALQFSVIETDSSFHHSASNNALGCAYGTPDSNNSTDGLGCTFGTTPNLLSIPSSLTLLTLKSGADSNNGTNLSAGKSRYFLIGVKQPDLNNTYQNRQAAFSLLWHIDQS